MHGANRLGTNSLLDLLVFGRAAGNHIVEFNDKTKAHKPLPADAADRTLARLARLDGAHQRRIRAGRGQRHARHHAEARRRVPHPGPADGRRRGAKINELRERVAAITLKDKSKVFNTARIEALEVDNLIEAAQATIVSAAARRECRGAHTVNDYERGADDAEFPLGRNDAEWMKHTLWYSEGNRLDYKPVNLKPLTVDASRPRSARSERDRATQNHDQGRTFQIYRYDPDKDAKPLHADLRRRARRPPTACCSTR